MGAVRCAARSLGGSLLQRTLAAVAGEGRRLVPSRFMRPRQLSGEVSSEISKRLQERSALESEAQCRMEALRASWHKLADLHKEAAPDAFELYVKAYGNAAKAVVRGAAKALFCFSLITSLIFGGNEVHDQAATKENQ